MEKDKKLIARIESGSREERIEDHKRVVSFIEDGDFRIKTAVFKDPTQYNKTILILEILDLATGESRSTGFYADELNIIANHKSNRVLDRIFADTLEEGKRK